MDTRALGAARTYEPFSKSGWGKLTTGVSILAAIIASACMMCLPIFLSVGLVTNATFDVLNFGSNANSTLISSGTGHFSPPPGSLAFLALYQFASDLLIAMSVTGACFFFTQLKVARTVRGTTKAKRVVLAHVTAPVEPVFVDFAKGTVDEQLSLIHI